MGDPDTPRSRRPSLAWLCFPLAALLLLWPVLVGGLVLVPGEYLKAFAPWEQALGAGDTPLPQWNVLQWDGMAQFYPWRMELARAYGEGRVPLWNPWVLSGTPFLANSQSAPLYPLHALFALPLGTVAAKMGWLAFLHLSLAGLFACWLARHHGARPLAAITAGLAYELSGFAVAWLELPSFITVACWIPLVLLCLGRAVRELSPFWTACAVGATGMMLLGGHLQVAFYGLIAAGLCWLWETAARRGVGEWSRAALVGVIVVGGGLALAAVQFLPSLELSRVSHRVGAPSGAGYAGYLGLAMPPQNWITLLAPDYYGLPGRGDFWGFWKYFAPNTVEYAGHVGPAAFVLALVGLGAVRRQRAGGLWVALALLALLLATGTPLNRLFYFYVPGFAQSGSPARVLVLFCLAQAMLAGWGTEWLLRRSEEGWTRALRPLCFATAAAAALLLVLHQVAVANLPAEGPLRTAVSSLFQRSPDEMLARVSQPALLNAFLFTLLPLLGWGLLSWLMRENPARQRSVVLGSASAILTVGVLLAISGPYNQMVSPGLAYPQTPLTEALQGSGARVATVNREWSLVGYAPAVLPPNASIAYGWRDAQGYDSLALGAYRKLAAAVAGEGKDAAPDANGNIVFVKEASSPLLPLLGVRYVVTREPVQAPHLLPAPGLPAGPPHVYEVANAVPEAYAVTRWAVAEDSEAAARLRQLPPGQLSSLAVVAPGQGVDPLRTELLEPRPGAPGKVERLSPGHLRVTAAPELPSLLVLAESIAPGWHVRVQEQGRQARDGKLLRVNLGFQGVLVGSGPVTAEWRYQPASFRVGLFLTLTTALVFLAAIVGTYQRRKADPGDALGDPGTAAQPDPGD